MKSARTQWGPAPVRAIQVGREAALRDGLAWPAMRFVLPSDYTRLTEIPDSRALLLTVPQILGVDMVRAALTALPKSHNCASEPVLDYLDDLRIPLEYYAPVSEVPALAVVRNLHRA